MSDLRQLHLRGATGTVRTEQLDGRRHLVVPVVALMEGVIHAVNAETPEFVSITTLKRAAASWNDKPVTLGHPKKDGKQCSANDPVILTQHGIGVIKNSRVEGQKLLQEAWIDEEKVKALHPGMHGRLIAGEREEVSVGAFVVTDPRVGDWRGKPFKAAWLETTGDHLAFLPGGRGACSIEMGCGAHRAAMHLVTAEEFRALWPDSTGYDDHGRGDKSGANPRGEKPAHVSQAEWDKANNGRTSYDNRTKRMGDGSFPVGEHVTISERHWDKSMHGKTGIVKSVATSGEGKPTHWVKTPEGRGQFVHADELEPVTPGKRYDGFDRTGNPIKMSVPEKRKRTLELFEEAVQVLARAYDCEACGGTGQIKEDGKQHDCPTCNGEGKMRAASAKDPEDIKIIQDMHDHVTTLGASCEKKKDYKTQPFVRPEGGRWAVYSTDGTRRLGSHGTEAEAQEQRSAIAARLNTSTNNEGRCSCGGH